MHSSLVSHQQSRYHYMDNLRALAMLVGIVFHAILAYSPLLHNIWFLADQQHSVVVDVIAFWLHTFRMPLFFIIAGFFAYMLIEKRGVKGFIKNRSTRVLLPLIVFLPLVIGIVVTTIFWAMDNIHHLPPVLAMSKELEKQNSDLSTAHLWFLFNLFGFCLVLAALYKNKLVQGRWTNDIASVPFLLVMFPVLIIPATYSVDAPFPAPEKLYPELWSYGFYGVFFFVGVAIFKRQKVLEQLYQHRHVMLAIATCSYLTFYALMPKALTIDEVKLMIEQGAKITQGFEHVAMVILQAFSSVYFSLLALCYGKKLIDKQNAIVRYIADASYWLYIVHIPLLLLIQMPMLDWQTHAIIKLIAALTLTFVIGFISYHFLVRKTWLGQWLNGQKVVSKKVADLAVD
ncbi:acyltransferase family protein [Thalassotalea marina]|uniref:Acyltransferase 3 domain-containing protein n=1 Tax=Thalassotalea marina TaxID=1673741 RepID=A0A919BN97_9GAMM|nr:acyltransferase family protein [Thalassotalea marina]GHG01223.1 hypothetical protein GCM10017161_32340 [Thalassotalea marina]